MRASEPLSRRDMRVSEPFEPSSICEQVSHRAVAICERASHVSRRRYASKGALGAFARRLVFWASFRAPFHLSECECRGSATSFAMSRYSDDFPMVDVIAICKT